MLKPPVPLLDWSCSHSDSQNGAILADWYLHYEIQKAFEKVSDLEEVSSAWGFDSFTGQIITTKRG